MNQKFHPGPHPDADQLSIFAEGADSASERERMLAHLAECQDCRDALFLMQRPVEISSAAKEVSSGWAWQKWLLSAGLAGAALAGLALLLVYVRPSSTVPERIRESAAVQQPEIGAKETAPVPSNNATRAARPENDKSASGRVTTSAAKEKSEGAADAKDTIRSNVQGTETVVASSAAAAVTEAATTPSHDTQLSENSAVTQQVPVRGRNYMNVQAGAPPLSQAPQAESAQDSVKAQQNLPALQVRRINGQDGPLSGVSGQVTDPSGATVAGATVALRDASGTLREITTAADGRFRLMQIPAGNYNLTVTAAGFQRNEQSIDLKPNELAMLEPVLNVGSLTTEVTVTANEAHVQTDSSNVAALVGNLPSRSPIASSVSLGKRILSLDEAGIVFLSRNAGKSWKKVHPQWTGKALRIALVPAAPANAGGKTSGAESTPSTFQLTTDSGSQWTSKDGTHWRPE